MSQHQASILDHLHPTKAKSLSELAEHMGVGRSAMSINVARLVQRGYVARQSDPVDARRVNLTLTARGERIAQSNSVLDPELLTHLLRPLSATELESALAGIERLAASARVLLTRRHKENER